MPSADRRDSTRRKQVAKGRKNDAQRKAARLIEAIGQKAVQKTAPVNKNKRYVRAANRITTYERATKNANRVIEPPNKGKKPVAGPPRPSADRIRRLNTRNLFERLGEGGRDDPRRTKRRFVDPLIDLDENGRLHFKKGTGELLKTETRRELERLADRKLSPIERAKALDKLQKKGQLPKDADLKAVADPPQMRNPFDRKLDRVKGKGILSDKRLLALPGVGPAIAAAKGGKEVTDRLDDAYRLAKRLNGPEWADRGEAIEDLRDAITEVNIRTGGKALTDAEKFKTAGVPGGYNLRETAKRGLFAGASTGGSALLRAVDTPAGVTLSALGKGLVEAGAIKGDTARKIREAKNPGEVVTQGRDWDEDVTGADLAKGLGLPKELGLPIDLVADPLNFAGIVLAPATGGTTGALAVSRAVQRLRTLAPEALQSEDAIKALRAYQRDKKGEKLAAALNDLLPAEKEAEILKTRGVDAIKREVENFRVTDPKFGQQGKRRIRTKKGDRNIYMQGSGPDSVVAAILNAQSKATKPQLRLQFMTPAGSTRRKDGTLRRGFNIPIDLSGAPAALAGRRKLRGEPTRVARIKEAEKIRLQSIADDAKDGIEKQIEFLASRGARDEDPRIQSLKAKLKDVDDELSSAKASLGLNASDPYKGDIPNLTLGDVFADRALRDEIRAGILASKDTGLRTEREISRALNDSLSVLEGRGTALEDKRKRVQLMLNLEADTGAGKLVDEIFQPTADERQAMENLRTLWEGVGSQAKAVGAIDGLMQDYTGLRTYRSPLDRINPMDRVDPRLRSPTSASQRARAVQSIFDIAEPDEIAQQIQRLARGSVSRKQAREWADIAFETGLQRVFSTLTIRQMQRGRELMFDALTPTEKRIIMRGEDRGYAGVGEPLFRTPRREGVEATDGRVLPGQWQGFPEEYGTIPTEPYAGLTREKRIESQVADIDEDLAGVNAMIAASKRDDLKADLEVVRDRLMAERDELTGAPGRDIVPPPRDDWEDVDGEPYAPTPVPRDPDGPTPGPAAGPEPTVDEVPQGLLDAGDDPFVIKGQPGDIGVSREYIDELYERTMSRHAQLNKEIDHMESAKLVDYPGGHVALESQDGSNISYYYTADSLDDPGRIAVFRYDIEEGEDIEVATYANLKNAIKGINRRWAKDLDAVRDDFRVMLDDFHKFKIGDDYGDWRDDLGYQIVAERFGLISKPEDIDLPRAPTEPGPADDTFNIIDEDAVAEAIDNLPVPRSAAGPEAGWEDAFAEATPPGLPPPGANDNIPRPGDEWQPPEAGRGASLRDFRQENDLAPELDPAVTGVARARQAGVQVGFTSRFKGIDTVYGRDIEEARKTFTAADGTTGYADELRPIRDNDGRITGYELGPRPAATGEELATLGDEGADTGFRLYDVDEVDIEPGALVGGQNGTFLDPLTGELYVSARNAFPTTSQVQAVGERRLWPTRVVDQVKIEAARLGELADNGAMVTLYDNALQAGTTKVISLTRFGVTLPFPAYHVRNMISDAIKSLQADSAILFHPLDNWRLMKLAFSRGLGKDIHVPGLGDMPREEFLLIADMFNVRTGHAATEIHALLANENPEEAIRASRRLMESFQLYSGQREDIVRLQSFLQRLRRNEGDAADAAWYMVRHHFDYNDLSDMERRFARNLFLFYTWYRKNIPLQMLELFRRPGFFAGIAKVYENAEAGTTPIQWDADWNPIGGPAPDVPGRPDYVKDKMQAITLAWKDQAIDIGFGAPWSDVAMITASEDMVQTMLSLGSPLVTGPLLLRREDPVTGRRFRDYEPGGPANIVDFLTGGGVLPEDEKGRAMLPAGASSLLRQLPFLGRAAGGLTGLNPTLDQGRLNKYGRATTALHGLNLNVQPAPGSAREDLAIQNLIKAEVVAKRRQKLIDISNLPKNSKEYQDAIKAVDATALKFVERKGIDKKQVKQSGFYEAAGRNLGSSSVTGSRRRGGSITRNGGSGGSILK